MISYDRTRWWRTAISFHGTVLPHTLGRVGLFTLSCLALCILNDHFLVNHGLALPALDQLGHTVLGVTMSLLIVHRTTSSNMRFWEGRTAWGAIVNASRNIARQAGTYAPPPTRSPVSWPPSPLPCASDCVIETRPKSFVRGCRAGCSKKS